jgi:hypothetical protein
MHIQYGTPHLEFQNLEGPEIYKFFIPEEHISIDNNEQKNLLWNWNKKSIILNNILCWYIKCKRLREPQIKETVTFQDMFKKMKDCSAGKEYYSGSCYSTAGTCETSINTYF